MSDAHRQSPPPPGERSAYAHVCCCIDDVGDAGSAIAEARRLAGPSERLTVLHVAPREDVVAGGLTEWGVLDRDDPLAAARMWLEGTVAAAGAGEPVLLTGHPGEEAARWAGEHGVDLLVCSARGGGLRRHILGSFAAHLAGAAPCPVLLLAPPGGGAPPPSPPVGPFPQIAALTDGSDASLRALEEARRIGGGRGHLAVLLLRSRWRAALRRLPNRDGADASDSVREAARALTGAEPRRLSGRPERALRRWARGRASPLLVIAEETPLGPSLRRAADGLAAEGVASLLIARTATGASD